MEKPTPFPRKFLSYQFSGLEMKGKPARSSSEWRSVGLLSPSLTQHCVAEVWNSSQSQHRVKYSAVPFTPHFSFLFYQAVCFPVDPSDILASDRQLSLGGQEKEQKKGEVEAVIQGLVYQALPKWILHSAIALSHSTGHPILQGQISLLQDRYFSTSLQKQLLNLKLI